ncbi:MAG: hypothetical protein AAFR36_31110 [Bacteroidota bacterium]
MRVKYVRYNTVDLKVGSVATSFYDSLHDIGVPPKRKKYRPAMIGYESCVYAIWINGGHISYYIRDPILGDIYHAPSVCFDVIDPRISKEWQIKHDYINSAKNHTLGPVFPRTWLAIREWIEEPQFLEFYIDGRKREVSIMEAAAKKMEKEF